MISQRFKVRVLLSIALSVLMFSQVARAEYLGLLHGRSADVSRMADLSVDAGVVLADDYQLFGVRANWKLTPIFLVFGDVAFNEVGRSDGIPFGIGAMYTLENLVQGADIGFKLSYHRGNFESGPFKSEQSNIAFEFLASTQHGLGSAGNIDLYGNIGIQYLDINTVDDFEPSIGGGVIMPVGPGEVFAGVDFVDGAMFGGGFRFFF